MAKQLQPRPGNIGALFIFFILKKITLSIVERFVLLGYDKYMYAYRTRFKKEIVTEFLPPAKRFLKRPAKVAIVCIGMPGMPAKSRILEFLSKQGYWAFNPRYRGTWESGGKFLKKSPHEDILDIIDELPKGFKEAYGGKKFKVKPSEVHLFASSFGGPAAILASRDKRVSKVVAFSPVVDWRDHVARGETIDWTMKFAAEAFGAAYRFDKKDVTKLKSGKFYNPMAEADNIDGEKLFLITAKDDKIVGWRSIEKFAKASDARIKFLKRGGHFGVSKLMEPKLWEKIKKFLSDK